jgi:predicted metal-dependent hydrolase
VSTNAERLIGIEVDGLHVDVVRKAIKNLHVAVYPPAGRVRVAAPQHLDDEAIRLAVVSRLTWIRRKQEMFAGQARQSRREMITGESHYVQGHRYRLDVVPMTKGRPLVALRDARTLELRVRPDMSAAEREQLLERWYRRLLRPQVAKLMAKWEPIVGVSVAEWGIKSMKTRWGTCNTDARRIWINLELAKVAPSCVEYVVVHELVHLIEGRHNERFRGLMNTHLPQWRVCKDELNRGPLAHEDWRY